LATESGCSDPESRSQCITASPRTSIAWKGRFDYWYTVSSHITCENDRWPIGHGVGSGFARLHCAMYAERNGETSETSSGTLGVFRVPRYAVLHLFVFVLIVLKWPNGQLRGFTHANRYLKAGKWEFVFSFSLCDRCFFFFVEKVKIFYSSERFCCVLCRWLC